MQPSWLNAEESEGLAKNTHPVLATRKMSTIRAGRGTFSNTRFP